MDKFWIKAEIYLYRGFARLLKQGLAANGFKRAVLLWVPLKIHFYDEKPVPFGERQGSKSRTLVRPRRGEEGTT